MSSDSSEDIIAYTNELFAIASDETRPQEKREKALRLHSKFKDQAFRAALSDFERGNAAFLDLSKELLSAVDSLGAANAADFERMIERIGDLQADLRDTEAMGVADDGGEREEVEGRSQPIRAATTANMRDEYVRFFTTQAWKNEEARRLALRHARSAISFLERYEAVGEPLGIPWWFIAGLHLLESGFNFTTHLHNGDRLSARTVRVPRGRPVAGKPPFRWEDSAKDALELQKLTNLEDWSLPNALARWEAYNGFGYRHRGIPTPYLWSMSTIYTKGKYVSDGRFDPEAISRQCGAAVFLRGLFEERGVELDPALVGEL